MLRTLKRLASSAARGSEHAGPKRVLAVDDSATYLETLAERSRAEGYDVVEARSGEEALELLAIEPSTASCSIS